MCLLRAEYRVLHDARLAQQLADEIGDLLVHHRAHEFAQRGLCAGDSALGDSCEHAFVGGLQPRVLAVPGGETIAHYRVLRDGFAVEFQLPDEVEKLGKAGGLDSTDGKSFLISTVSAPVQPPPTSPRR